jgi:hypothetical protein
MNCTEELRTLRKKKTHIDRAITALERLQALSTVQRATARHSYEKNKTPSPFRADINCVCKEG